MIQPAHLVNLLKKLGINFYAGVPDSLLSEFCTILESNQEDISHTVSANEGLAISLACGHYLATGNIPLVYMQNSGFGNAVNPLVSLCHSSVYQVPVLLFIGWRGEPLIVDQPQHRKQGEITPPLLTELDIPYSIVDADTDITTLLTKTIVNINRHKKTHALLFKKNCFAKESNPIRAIKKAELNYRTAIEFIVDSAGENSIFVTTTGHISRILNEIRTERGDSNQLDFLNVGAMGHTAQIALGIALEKPDKKVYCLDGDGALLMHMGGLTTIGAKSPKNLVHVLLNNGCHASVGGHPTLAFDVDLQMIVRGCGYPTVMKTNNQLELTDALTKAKELGSLIFLEITIGGGIDGQPSRPKESTLKRKEDFMNYLFK